MPEDFAVSDRVRRWAVEKGFGRLDEHLEAFKSSVAAHGYRYVDWDEALMNAIRKDWARLRVAAPKSFRERDDANARAKADAWMGSAKPKRLDPNVIDMEDGYGPRLAAG